MMNVGRWRVGPLVTSLFLTFVLTGAVGRGDSVFDVTIGGASIGNFTVGVYHGEVTNTPQGVLYGAAIQGVFTPGGTLGLPLGYEYRWIQTVSSTAPIYQPTPDWQLPNVTYVDRTRADDGRTVADGSPFYANRFDPVTGTLPFQDNPSRLVEEFDGNWTLTLVAVEAPSIPGAPFDVANPDDDRDIFAITSFVWGFSYGVGASAVTLKDLVQQAADLDALKAAFARDVAFGDPNTFSSRAWTLRAGFPTVVIPEPSSFALLSVSLLIVAFPAATARCRTLKKTA
ncbi:hypothetical protein [Paludisphaera soli]|uniref:hypothetical protein n=1 Tax=Paludisphaera soli TaxID=2712865 RepID=UPI0013ED79D7|nr:hypothetical protein [Paludisphaera soli]